jgi:hypothetical protein
MKKSKVHGRKTRTKTTTKLPPRKAPGAPGKMARLKSPESAHGLETRELISKGTMDLDPHLLQMTSARAIAKSLKRSADESERLESTPFHSAMSVLGALISHVEVLRARLEAAKKELRSFYGESDEKLTGEHEAVSPQQYARRRSAPKGREAPTNEDKPSDNRPRSRPNKVV